MTTSWLELPEKARNQLAVMLSEFPLVHSVPALIADLSPGGPRLNNGTATLLKIGDSHLAITSDHVIQKYQDLRNADPRVLFQFGKLVLDPTSQLVTRNQESDLAVIDLNETQVSTIENSGKRFLIPVCWPPKPVEEGDWVSVGGYSGTFREQLASDVLDFKGYSIGATSVTSATENQVACQFARERWIRVTEDDLPDPSRWAEQWTSIHFALTALGICWHHLPI